MIKKKVKRKKIKNIMLSTSKMTREIGISSLSKWTIMRRNTNLKWKKIRENSLLRSKFRYCLFSSFLLSNEIGNGSFGRVYQGFDNDHGIVIAVK